MGKPHRRKKNDRQSEDPQFLPIPQRQKKGLRPRQDRGDGGGGKRIILEDGSRRCPGRSRDGGCPGRSRDGGRVMTPRRTLRRRMGKKGSRRRPTGWRGRRGTRERLKLVSPLKNGRRDLGERANNHLRMRHLKGLDIRAMVDGERVAVVSGESEKSRIVPLRDINLGGVKIPIDFILDARKGGKDKNLGTDERRRRRGGGRSNRRRREERRRRRKILRRIHNILFFFFLTLAGREMQRQVDNNGENDDRADDANGRALCVDGDRCERNRRRTRRRRR